jgi:hypothetical protein
MGAEREENEEQGSVRAGGCREADEEGSLSGSLAPRWGEVGSSAPL